MCRQIDEERPNFAPWAVGFLVLEFLVREDVQPASEVESLL